MAEAANGELWRLKSDGGILFNQNLAKPTQTFPSDARLKQIAVGSTGALDTALTVEERQQMLDAHNSERQRYPGVGPLQWAPQIGAVCRRVGTGCNHGREVRPSPGQPEQSVQAR